MSKRNIRPNSGKQLYLNQIFYKGMLYTSSEMQEGFARVIDNYDIAPTGDAATPRHPLRLLEDKTIGFNNSYTVPVKFKQFEGKQSYIKFYKTISEEEFANDTQTVNNNLTSDITLINRNNNIINNEESGSISNEIRYTIKEQSTDEPIEDPLEEIKKDYQEKVRTNQGLGFDTTKNKFTFTQNYYDGTKLAQRDIDISYTKGSKLLPIPGLNILMTVIDGDTFKDGNGITHRLFGVDASELGYEWSEYAKIILEKISGYWLDLFEKFPGADYKGYQTIRQTVDVYGRNVSKVLLYFDVGTTDPNFYYCIDVSEMLLSLGLVTMRYIDRTENPDTFDRYKEYQDIARANKYKIFSENDFDPFYENVKANISLSEGNNLQITEDMFIEAVKIKDGFNISALTQTVVDFVHTVYIDYLDAVGFIGRVLQGTEIIYKGPILLQARVDDDGNEGFVVLLPSNQGEGVTPNLIEASTTNSYNLINDNMINIENEKDEYSAFNILGATVLYKDVSGNINTDNPQVVTQGIIGQEILLKSIINEEGFYNYSDITTTDNYGFEIVLEPIVVEGVTLFESRKINRAVNEFTNVTTDVLGLAYAVEQATKGMSEEEKSKIPTTWEGVLDKTDIKIRSITLIKNSNNSSQNVKLSTNEINSTLSTDVSALWDGSVLEIRSELKIDDDELVINFHNNFSTINMTFTEGSNLVLRENSLPLEFYSKWLVSDYGNESFRDIQSELLIYKKSGGTNTLTKVGDWTSGIIKPTDLSYVLSGNSNLSFKYSIQPKIHNKLSNSCPSTLSDIRLVNTFQEMYMIIPLLKIGTEIEVISDKDLRTNMNIKNATRIEVFNRQICVYGPYTTSNVLFFSKFETFDYFPFPSGVIELEEPITWVYNYKDSFIIFGKNHLHMLTGATLASECALHKIYENLSIHLPDVRITNTVGNNLIFFNNGVGYVIVPNTYVDSSSNIKVYKLTEYISNFFYNPEAYIRNRIPTDAIDSVLTYKMEFDSYVQNNDIVITNNITVNEGANEHHLVTWFIYNQDFKYWRMYSTTLFNRILANYVCEPNVNHQFIVEKDNKAYMSFFQNVYTIDYKDNNIPIKTMIDSGYLSVDTMNDKRFKDIIIEFDKIDPMAKLYMNCEFFVDGSPIILSDTTAVIIDKLTGAIMETEKVLSDYRDYELHHIGTSSYDTSSDTITREQMFGTTFEIDNQVYSTTGRTHMRIPVYGKGRLPSFILKIESDKGYEFINYALIYKEKNINRRS